MLDTATLLESPALRPLWQHLQSSTPYQPGRGWTLDNPYHRPTDLTGLSPGSLGEPLRMETLCTRRSLVLNRLLFNIYEQNNLYLPPARFSEQEMQAFHGYYAPDFVAANALLRPVLERCAQLPAAEVPAGGAAPQLRRYAEAATLVDSNKGPEALPLLVALLGDGRAPAQ